MRTKFNENFFGGLKSNLAIFIGIKKIFKAFFPLWFFSFKKFKIGLSFK